MTFIELLVSIVLLGTLVVGTLAAVRATVIGSRVERDHARAHEWLQSATEILVNDIAWDDCDPLDSAGSAATLQSTYQSALQGTPSIVPAASGAATQISISEPVEFAGPSGSYGATCFGVIDRQLVTIQVVDPDGTIIEDVEVVKVP